MTLIFTETSIKARGWALGEPFAAASTQAESMYSEFMRISFYFSQEVERESIF